MSETAWRFCCITVKRNSTMNGTESGQLGSNSSGGSYVGGGVTDDADMVATWQVPMSDRVYTVEFLHGTTTGKRIVRVNGKNIVHHEWMFKLVGRENFEMNQVRCSVNIEAIGIFAYEYTLKVGGKTFEKFREQQRKALQVWNVHVAGEEMRVCLEKDSMDVWVNGWKANTTGEFMEHGGSRTHFEIPPNAQCYIDAESSGKRKVGLVYKLFVNGNLVEPLQQ